MSKDAGDSPISSISPISPISPSSPSSPSSFPDEDYESLEPVNTPVEPEFAPLEAVVVHDCAGVKLEPEGIVALAAESGVELPKFAKKSTSTPDLGESFYDDAMVPEVNWAKDPEVASNSWSQPPSAICFGGSGVGGDVGSDNVIKHL